MQNFTYRICYKQIQALAASTVLFLLFSTSVNAQLQSRKYTISYSDNLQGSTAMFGNTVEAIYNNDNVTVDTAKMNATRRGASVTVSSGNNGANMQYIDIDGSNTSNNGNETFNSSSADLSLPAGVNTIKFARLYWGGRTKKNDYDMTLAANQTIKIRKGTTGGYFLCTANHIDDTLSGNGTSNTPYSYDYQAYTDITSFIQTNGTGTYTVGNIPASIGVDPGGASGYYGGWSIVIAYENTSAFANYNSVRIYDGYQGVNGSNTVNVTLNNLNVPSGALALSDAKMGVLTWEGDAQLTGDGLKINNNSFSDAVNLSTNVFNGSISDNGVYVHSKNPDYFNEMALDIDQFNVGTGFGIKPNDQNVTLTFSTNGDGYWPGVFTFVIKTKTPNPNLNKFVSDSNGNHIAEANELLTYTFTGQNTGIGNANSTIISDTLPSTVTYVPGSLKVIYAPNTTAGSLSDASGDDVGEYITNGSVHTVRFQVGTGATGTKGGTLIANDSFHYQFQARVNKPAVGSVPPIVNIATVIALSDANSQTVDFGIAIIDPQGGPLPVSLTSFSVSVNQNDAKVNWSTSLENNCKEYYVQRSTNGSTFTTVETVAGHGTTARQNNYSVTDDIFAVNAPVVYYRLAQVDGDGKINYSRVVTARLQDNGVNGITVSPNPFSSSINVSLSWGTNEPAVVKVLNMLGRVVASKSIQLNKGTNYVSIDELSGLPSGNYLLQVSSLDGSLVKEITKQ